MKCKCGEELAKETFCSLCKGVGGWDDEECLICDGSGLARDDEEKAELLYCKTCGLIYEFD